MKLETKQTKIWKGEFGRAYSDRNALKSVQEFNDRHVKRFGFARDPLYADWLADLRPNARILEIGCNIGFQLASVGRAGFHNLFGIEIQEYCIEQARDRHPHLTVLGGSGLAIPFADNTFDLVFTNHVLIHFSQADLSVVMSEIHRVCRGYIMGHEYYAPDFTEVNYRGHDDLLWKADYPNLYLALCPGLRVERQERFLYLDGRENYDIAYLLAKERSRAQ